MIAYDSRNSSALIVKHPPEENRLISVAVSGQTTQFVYDGDGNLVKKINPDNSKTIYVGGVYEVDKTSGGSDKNI